MGLDLTLCPIRRVNSDWWLLYDRIRLQRDYNLFPYIGPDERSSIEPVMQGREVPLFFKIDWYGDDGLKTITSDSFGNPLTYVYAVDFAKIPLDSLTVSPWNQAVIAFMLKLPPDTPVVLYWS